MVNPDQLVQIEIVFFAIVLLYLVFLGIRYWRSWILQRANYVPKVDERIETIIAGIPYFKALSADGKMAFIKRVRGLSRTKRFKGMHGLSVTEEMRVGLSASLVQLTFGFPSSEISSFKTILVFPDTFYHPLQQVEMKGFTSPTTGTLAVSWPDFVHGYADPNDNYNLGLHELAHALHINASKTYDNRYFRRHFKYWTEKSLTDFYDLKENRMDFLRAYGGTNFHEFFAVVVEHFFESPRSFFERIPHLYIRTCVLLNQNPLNAHNDYVFDWLDFPGYHRFTDIKTGR